MKKLNTWIDYMKLVIVLLLFLLGSSEISTPAFFVFLTLLTAAVGWQIFLVRARKRLCMNRLMARLERAAEENKKEVA